MTARHSRHWVWLHLLIGWLPVWALYSTLVLTAHEGSTIRSAVFAGLRATTCAALLGLLVHRFTNRVPWPNKMRWSFMLMHLAVAALYSASWVVLSLSLELLLGSMHGAMAAGLHGASVRLVTRVPVVPFLILGGWMYASVTGVSYALQSVQRVAKAEALAAEARLAALRAQLNPHFLFNALHTVVQLIPIDPSRATNAAERLAVLLRSGIEEQRDLIPLADEWAFVSRYLELEQLRFGDRLATELSCDVDAQEVLVPSFSLQTLVENAVQHGAAPRVERTHVVVRVTDSSTPSATEVTIEVSDDGVGADLNASRRGTGLSRLRDRLQALFGDAGSLSMETAPGRGFRASMSVPYQRELDARTGARGPA